MEFRELLKQTYRECGELASLRYQKSMVLEDNAGLHGLRYDTDRVTGGFGGDLTDTLLSIEKHTEQIDRRIALTLEKLMEHRAEVYELLALVPDGDGKTAVQEHYLFRVSWAEIAARRHYSREWTRHLAYECVCQVEEVMKDNPKKPL